MNNEKIPNKVTSMVTMKCPNCRKGNMFTNKSIIPISKMMDMPEHCPNCGLKYERELGFWYGTGYVSYAISVGLIFVMAVLFALTIGFSWRNNSVYWFLGGMVTTLVLLQPIIMRISRVLYLYGFVGFQSEEFVQKEKSSS